jgi:hypothetical protein
MRCKPYRTLVRTGDNLVSSAPRVVARFEKQPDFKLMASLFAQPTSGQQKCCAMCRTAASGTLQCSALTFGQRQVWAVLDGRG